MTRWTFYIIGKEDGKLQMKSSIEFNGNMYPKQKNWAWYWDVAMERLKETNYKEFDTMIEKFNKDHHNYNDELLTWEEDFEDWKQIERDLWSDYTFWKNDTNQDITLNLKEDVYILRAGECVRFNFSHFSTKDEGLYKFEEREEREFTFNINIVIAWYNKEEARNKLYNLLGERAGYYNVRLIN